jgi:hypothetical protein
MHNTLLHIPARLFNRETISHALLSDLDVRGQAVFSEMAACRQFSVMQAFIQQ